MKSIVILITALLAGCATSPAEVVERGTRFTGEIAGTPSQAANCVARTAEKTGSYLTSTHTIEGGGLEMMVRSSAVAYFTLAVWRFTPRTNGSAFEAWVSSNYQPSHAELLAKMRGGC